MKLISNKHQHGYNFSAEMPFDLTAVQRLGNSADILCKFSAQKASGNLDSSEHIYLGGAHGVRAYLQGEASGDEGVLGTVELRYHTPVKGLTLSAYFDAGHVEISKSGGNGNMTLKGWGMGLSYIHPGNWFARLDYARRMLDSFNMALLPANSYIMIVLVVALTVVSAAFMARYKKSHTESILSKLI